MSKNPNLRIFKQFIYDNFITIIIDDLFIY